MMTNDPDQELLEPVNDLLMRMLTIVELLVVRVDILELELLHLRRAAPESLTDSEPRVAGRVGP